MRYADGGGLTEQGRATREAVRLRAAEWFAQDLLFGYHRLAIRYDRYANQFCAFRTLAATLTCYTKLAKTTMRDMILVRQLYS
ncbi:hypothetical protein ACL02T_16065 [Pseudonocardia sp. RS010]|uniref:hypothetical protein n=1 Tax=Pseudonocardia sp. RS010 TaxID=3385979 RepID=UPI00399F598E